MKFYIETYGCQMNVADSELIAAILTEAGHKEANQIEDADLLLFNTCSVRAHAENRVLGRIRSESSRKKDNPNLKIGVVGCMAQRIGKELIDNYLTMDFVVGVDQYANLPDIIEKCIKENYWLDFDEKQIYKGIQPTYQNAYSAFVTIMRGCNNFCSYCIVPYVRGRERSRPWQDIVEETILAGKQGRKDITLLGQNVNSYNDNEMKFPGLLTKLNKLDEIYRLRFITSHPKDLSDELIEVLSTSANVCEHIHLPLQSGSDKILKAMNRKYTAMYYLDLIHKLHKAIPNIAITTDIMTGFPDETDSDFQDTIDVMKQVGFDDVFCYKFSPRPGTAAASMKNQVSESEGLNRLQRMIDLQRNISLQKNKAKIGKKVEVYVENYSKKSVDIVSGKTRDFKVAVLPGTESDFGTLKTVEVKDATASTLICF
ncbi:MAG: tRNA (N6-isopentenyl adenosine(37)-C2)-methylthiotransferase MiaB [Candidatus Cloacimonas sp.]